MMRFMGVADVALALGMTKSAVRKAITRKTLRATLVPGGRRGAEYVVSHREVVRYGETNRRPEHRKVTTP